MKSTIKSLISCCLLISLMTLGARGQETEVSVMKGKVVAQSDKGKVEVVAGQRGVLQPGQAPVAAVDDELVGNLIEMDSWVEAEKKEGKIKIEGSAIMVQRWDSEKACTLFSLVEMSGAMNKATDTCRMGKTQLGRNDRFYDMEGKELPFEIEKVTPKEGYYNVHFPKPIAGGEKFKFIYVSEFDINPAELESLKDNNVWYMRTRNQSRNFLNYYCIVLPPSAIYVRSSLPPVSVAIASGRVAVTMRNYTGPERKSNCMVGFLWPDHDGTSIKDLPMRYLTSAETPNENLVNQYRREVTEVFAAYQKACRERNFDGYVGYWDGAVKKEDLQKIPELLDLIAAAKAESVEPYEGVRYATYRPVMVIKGGDWEWYLRQTAQGWRLFSQELSNNAQVLSEIIEAQRKANPNAAVRLPEVKLSPAVEQEARAAFQAYQRLCAKRDLDGLVKMLPFDDKDKNRAELLKKQLADMPDEGFYKPIAASQIRSIEVGLQFTEANPKKNGMISQDPVVLIRGDGGWFWYLRKMAGGWKLLTQGNSKPQA